MEFKESTDKDREKLLKFKKTEKKRIEESIIQAQKDRKEAIEAKQPREKKPIKKVINRIIKKVTKKRKK